jgi:hypothetical protein
MKFVCFLVILTGIFLPKNIMAQSNNQPIAGSSDLSLSKEQISKLTKDAGSGNGEAAFDLYFYYQLYQRDSETAWNWLKKSAELGCDKAQYTLSYRYTIDPKVKDSTLALYWLKKAAENGNIHAIKKLQEKTFPTNQ